MTNLDLGALRAVVGEQPYPLLFATVSGAHLYGFPSRDSDVDLRGVHALPVEEVVGLTTGPETLTEIVCYASVLAQQVPESPDYLGEAKRAAEHDAVDLAAVGGADRVGQDVERLTDLLAQARETTTLPESPSAQPALHDLVVRLRTGAASV